METRTERRSYHQYCAVARGLDVIGERWTLLLVRELLVGPKRYKDLLEGLPGIGTNLLATRLRELEEAGLVRKAVLPPPAGSSVYELTEIGRALEPVLMSIGRWGHRYLGAVRPDDSLSTSAYFLAMRASFKPEAAEGLKRTFEFRIGERVFEVRVADGSCSTREGRAADPDAVFSMDVETLNSLLIEGLEPAEAMAKGRVRIEGDPEALEEFVRIFVFRRVADIAAFKRAVSPAASN